MLLEVQIFYFKLIKLLYYLFVILFSFANSFLDCISLSNLLVINDSLQLFLLDLLILPLLPQLLYLSLVLDILLEARPKLILQVLGRGILHQLRH